MRKAALLIGALALAFALQAQGNSSAFFQGLFWKQLSATCHPGLRLEKAVMDIGEDGSKEVETKVFDLDCYHGTATADGKAQSLDLGEFAYLFEYTFDNPYVADKLVVTQQALVTEAKPKAGESDCNLLLQRFELSPDTGALTRAQTKIAKTSPLYDLEIEVVVTFDAQGRYIGHTIDTKTDVLLGGVAHTLIQARLLP